MAQWVKASATKINHLNSIPRMHMVEGKTDSYKNYSSPCTCNKKCKIRIMSRYLKIYK